MAEFPDLESADDLARRAWGRLCEHWLNHALEFADRALAIQPDHPSARQIRGVAQMRMGRNAAGLHTLEAVAADGLDNVGFWLDMTAAYERVGRAKDADNAWDRAVAHQANLSQAPADLRALFVSERRFHKYKIVDYDSVATGRYGFGRPAHPELTGLLARDTETFRRYVDRFADTAAGVLADIPLIGDYASDVPFWLNSWMAPLDGMSLAGMLAHHQPARYVEIGSGVSTKFARRTIEARGLTTRILSIDPAPRNRIDRLVDDKIRKPFEQVAGEVVEMLEPGDILFFDGSHRSFPGSDVTVFFLEVLPRLRPGVIVHVHDIYLPDDYPAGHIPRLWNEQYLLACALLYGASRFEVLFPGWFASQTAALSGRIHERLRPGSLADSYIHGLSFWMRTV